jgi:hypothetical protein
MGNVVYYPYLDLNCTEPDTSASLSPIWTSEMFGCNSFGASITLLNTFPTHPYGVVFKWYSFPNCTGRPEISWVDPVYARTMNWDCLASRDVDFPTHNVPFSMDCAAGTYAVYDATDEFPGCPIDRDSDFARPMYSGKLQFFRYYNRCLGNYAHPIDPTVVATCGGSGFQSSP